MCIKRSHIFASLLVGLGSLGEALELSAPVQAGLGPEVLVLWVLRVLIVGYDHLRGLLPLTTEVMYYIIQL